MNVAILSGLKRPIPAGWTKETLVTILGGVDLDFASSPPGADAHLTVVTVLGGVKIRVAPGTRVALSGFSFLGGREVKVTQSGDGPLISMNLWALLGGIEVKETEGAAPA